MADSNRPRSSREKIKAHRRRSPTFKAEAHRQSLAVAESAHAQEDQEFIGAVSELGNPREAEAGRTEAPLFRILVEPNEPEAKHSRPS